MIRIVQTVLHGNAASCVRRGTYLSVKIFLTDCSKQSGREGSAMKNIGIIGLGLIGGSIAKSLKRYDGYVIKAFNRSRPSIDAAIADGIIDDGSAEDISVLSGSEIIFICTPVDLIPGYVDKLLPIIDKDCIITDVGSTKANIYRKMLGFGDRINYIGGHPMAGSEQTSYKAAKPFLLENAYYVVAPSPYVKKEYVDKFTALIELTGAVPIVIDPDEHDYTVAAISHVPHIIAASLVNTVKRLDGEQGLMHALAAGGFKDITRIASSSPEVWTGICLENKVHILKVLESFKADIDSFAQAIADSDADALGSCFACARDYRNSFSSKLPTSYATSFELYVDTAEKQGIIASVASILSLNNINIKSIGVVANREYANGILRLVLDSKEAKEKCHDLLTRMNYTVYDK